MIKKFGRNAVKNITYKLINGSNYKNLEFDYKGP